MAQNTSSDTRRRIARHIESLADSEQEAAVRAEMRLIRFGWKALPQLLSAANSADPQVRYRVVWALGKIRDLQAFEAICRLTEDVDPRVRYDAVLALGELGAARAVPILRALASQPEDKAGINSAAQIALRRLKQVRQKAV